MKFCQLADEARIFGDAYYELENKIVERLKKEEN